MALVPLNAIRIRKQNCRGKNYSSATAVAVDDSTIALAIPSICKTETGVHGLVNSMVTLNIMGEITYMWCIDTVATIYGLS